MKKILLLTTAIISNSTQAKLSQIEQQDFLLAKLSTTKEIIHQETLLWNEKFYDSLINDNNPNIKVVGFKEKLNPIKSLQSKANILEVANSINEILLYETVSPKSLKNIKTICSGLEIKPHCRHDLIFEKQLELTPENAFIYIEKLHVAKQYFDYEEVSDILNEMANSKYMNAYYYPDPVFREKLESYVKDHPFPENKLKMEKLFSLRSSSLSDDDKQVISNNINEIMILTYVLSNRMSDSIPSFRTLIQVCENDPIHEKACLKIADILINKSKTILSTMIGHTIIIEILKQRNDPEKLKLAEANKENFKYKYECLSQIMNYGKSSFLINGFKFSRKSESVEREAGELAYYQTMANQNYKHHKSLGDKRIMHIDECNNKPEIVTN